MPTRNIKLTDNYDRFVEEQVEAGRYKNASEVLRAGLRLLEQQTRADEQKLTILKALATEGFDALDQGEGLRLSGEQQLSNAIRKIGQRAAKDVAARAKHSP